MELSISLMWSSYLGSFLASQKWNPLLHLSGHDRRSFFAIKLRFNNGALDIPSVAPDDQWWSANIRDLISVRTSTSRVTCHLPINLPNPWYRTMAFCVPFIVFLLYIIPALALYSPSGPVVLLNPKTFDAKIRNSKHASIVEFFAPWSYPSCSQLNE